VVVTTRPEPRAEIVIELAEMGVKAIFATKPMCRTLAEADAMIQACQKNNVILSMACHLNWYNWYTNARKVIADGVIGNLRSMICHSPASLSNLQSHTFALFRLFAGTPAKWVFGVLDNDQQAESHGDIPGSGYIVYENGIRAIMNSHAERTGLSWTIEFVGEKGRIISRNAHAQFELWTAHPETNAPIQTQFPNPWYPRSSMVDAIEGVCLSIEKGVEEICPGEFGRETLEIAIAIRESHKQGNTRLDIPLMDRSLRMG
jgi:predicted dehydrogenase